MAVGEIYKGDEFIFLVEIDVDDTTKIIRPFDQTNGGVSLASDEIEMSTKDRSGSDYGKVVQTVSLEGNMTEGDPFIDAMKKAIRSKKFVKIFEVNTRDKTAEYGMYMINTFDREYQNGEFATYTLEGTLFGDVCQTELTAIPEGAPTTGDGMACEPITDTGAGDD